MTFPVVLADVQSRFNPSKIAGLGLWLNAEKITGLSNGDPVVTWEDQSGNGNDHTQATGSKRPTYRTDVVNGKPVVRFDLVDDILSPVAAVANTDFTVVILFTDIKSTDTEKNMFMNTPDGNNRLAINGISSTFRAGQFNGSDWIGVGSGALTALQARIVTAKYVNSPRAFQFWIDGVEITGGTVANVADASGVSHCDVAEICGYNSGLANNQIARLEKYMSIRYAVSI